MIEENVIVDGVVIKMTKSGVLTMEICQGLWILIPLIHLLKMCATNTTTYCNF